MANSPASVESPNQIWLLSSESNWLKLPSTVMTANWPAEVVTSTRRASTSWIGMVRGAFPALPFTAITALYVPAANPAELMLTNRVPVWVPVAGLTLSQGALSVTFQFSVPRPVFEMETVCGAGDGPSASPRNNSVVGATASTTVESRTSMVRWALGRPVLPKWFRARTRTWANPAVSMVRFALDEDVGVERRDVNAESLAHSTT